MPDDLCLTLANHWSYTGIGWQLGLESCAQSIGDSLAMADYDPSVKTCLNLDALAYELVAERHPSLKRRLREYLRAGKVEIVGGTYGQPMGSMISGESNIRQLVLGQETIRKVTGCYVTSFLEEEEFSHPQLPQLLRGAGYQYASLAQCDTWGKHGSPPLDLNVFHWRGADGTTIPATAINGLVFHPPCVTHDIDWLWTEAGRARLTELQKLGLPLAIKWTEFGWETLRGNAINKFDPKKFRELSKHFRVRYVSLSEYFAEHAAEAKQTVAFRMDDFQKLQPWGVGGDQVRRCGREVEAMLLAAERFDAMAHISGLRTVNLRTLDQAWKQLLISQSHDVSLCEYSRWGGGVAPPLQPVHDAHFLTWGSLGYRHLDEARRLAREVLDTTLQRLSAAVKPIRVGQQAVVVFNPVGSERDALAVAELSDYKGEPIHVRNRRGQVLPTQLLKDEYGRASIAFPAARLPSVGYDTYSIAPGTGPAVTDLRFDEQRLTLENKFISVRLEAVTGAIGRLHDRRTGRDLLTGPTFCGSPNPEQPTPRSRTWDEIVEAYDSSKSKAAITWLQRGPLVATVRAVHMLPRVHFETHVTLYAGLPVVDLHARVFANIPPKPAAGNINGWQLPLEITDGYWLTFALAFTPSGIVRDYPFGIEATQKDAIDALTFVDFTGDKAGLLLVHGGTQYFKREAGNRFNNLIMREWESHFTGEYGWPRVADYRYRLIPHAPVLTNTERRQAVAEFDQPPHCVVTTSSKGRLPARRAFLQSNLPLAAFRRSRDGYEVRVTECEGRASRARVKPGFPVKAVWQTDLLGNRLSKGKTAFRTRPWGVHTLAVE